MRLFINPASKIQLDAVKRSLPGALLLSGQEGVGLTTLSRWLADKALSSFLQPTDAKNVPDSSGTISVESIRSLYDETRGKRTSAAIYIIDDADRMSPGAQAAFLKLLEEPNSNTHFILNSHHPERLLATITSRTQHVHVRPVTAAQTEEFLASFPAIDATKRMQLQFIAAGLPAELHRLISDEEYFVAKAKVMGDARTFLQASPYEKLVVIQRYQADREKALALIEGATRILRHSLSAKPSHGSIEQLERLSEVYERISRMGNIRLQLARAAV